MNPIEKIKRDHEDIERELIELETIMETDNINYSNLVHVLRKLHDMWDDHEEFEVVVFNDLKNRGYEIPIEKILFEHGNFAEHREKIIRAIESGSETGVKASLFDDGKFIIEKIRAHKDFEDELLYTIPDDIFNVSYNDEDLVDGHHGVSAVIRNSEGHVLMQDHVKFGFWTIPIGKADIGDDPIEGLKREILEECNLVVEDVREIVARDQVYFRDGKKVNVVVHVYGVLVHSGELKNNEPYKHREQKFIPVDEIAKFPYLSDSTVLFLDSIGIVRGFKLGSEKRFSWE